MTEAEWEACEDPEPMLALLSGKVSDRKLRLCACGCCHRFWRLMGERAIPREVEVAEQFADGEVELSQVRRIRSRLGGREEKSSAWAANGVLYAVLDDSAEVAAGRTMKAALDFRYVFASEGLRSSGEYQAATDQKAEREGLLRLVCDIFGNPFRPVTFDPAWRTSTAVALARGMYESRDFGAMPILADALQDAGCDNEDALNHCRGPGPHVRGCWVVDLVLGKA